MSSLRRPKQPSRARVTVLTTAAAAAVAISSQAANAAPSEKPSKDEVIAVLRETDADVLMNYLPVGSQAATEFYAE